MESKIEKLERVKPMALMGMMGEVAPQWVAKELNRIIDRLNSQAQPEEMTEDRIERARKKREECLKRFEDTPEEKGELKQFEEFLEDLVVGEGDDMDNLYLHSTEREEIMEKVKQLLEEREREVFTKEELKLLRSALGILDGWTVNGKEITELDLKPLYFKLERMFKLKTKE